MHCKSNQNLAQGFVNTIITRVTDCELESKPRAMIRVGTEVKWNWGSGSATGKVEETYDKEVTRTIKGSKITRKGSADDKALYIKQEDGDAVLKLQSEVERVD